MQSRDDLTRLAVKLGGLPVLGCRPGSPAARAGIRYGDIVLAVNGQPTPDWGTFLTARAAERGEMTVEIFRSGQHVVHRLTFDRTEPVDPLALLEELAEARLLGPRDEGRAREPESLPS